MHRNMKNLCCFTTHSGKRLCFTSLCNELRNIPFAESWSTCTNIGDLIMWAYNMSAEPGWPTESTVVSTTRYLVNSAIDVCCQDDEEYSSMAKMLLSKIAENREMRYKLSTISERMKINGKLKHVTLGSSEVTDMNICMKIIALGTVQEACDSMHSSIGNPRMSIYAASRVDWVYNCMSLGKFIPASEKTDALKKIREMLSVPGNSLERVDTTNAVCEDCKHNIKECKILREHQESMRRWKIREDSRANEIVPFHTCKVPGCGGRMRRIYDNRNEKVGGMACSKCWTYWNIEKFDAHFFVDEKN